MRALALVALTLLLAGCTEEPAPLVQREPTFSDADLPPPRPPARLEWSELTSGAFVLGPAHSFARDLTVPVGAIRVMTNLTIDAGGLHTLDVIMGECQWRREVALVAGQSLSVDCGGIAEGAAHVRVAIGAGAATGDVRVVALVCLPQPGDGGCPPRAPVT